MTWLQRVEQAVKSKQFTNDDIELVKLWITDPISEFASIIELRHNELKYGPKDLYLVLDGIFFTKAVEENDINMAVMCFKSMIHRVNKLHGTTFMAG